MRTLIKDDKFVNSMNDLGLSAWTSFVEVVKNFLDNFWVKNYQKLVEKLLKSLLGIGVNMSI